MQIEKNAAGVVIIILIWGKLNRDRKYAPEFNEATKQHNTTEQSRIEQNRREYTQRLLLLLC